MWSEANNRFILREGGRPKKGKRGHRPPKISIVRKIKAKPASTKHLIYVEDIDGCNLRKVNPNALIPFDQKKYNEMINPPKNEEETFEEIVKDLMNI